jgi:hypothetical protein
MIIIEPNSGTAKNLAFNAYAASKETNQSFIKTLIEKSPKHAKLGLKEETEALTTGTNAHSVVLEGVDPNTAFAPYDGVRRGAKWEAFKAEAKEADKTPVTRKDFDATLAMSKAVPSDIQKIIRESKVELAVFFDMHNIDEGETLPCKALIDCLHPEAIYDYKTTSKGVDSRSFKSTVGKYFYDLQAAWYQMAVESLTGVKKPFYWIVQESTAPYDVNVFRASDELLSNGYSWLHYGVGKYMDCVRNDNFPGNYKGEAEEIDSPDWHTFEPELLTENVTEVSEL